MSRCCEQLMHKEQKKVGNYSFLQTFSCGKAEPVEGGYPPLIRDLPTAYPQCFTQAKPSKSAGFPAFFLNFFTRISTGLWFGFFRSVFATIPEELAGSTGEKNGVNRAGMANCGKRRRGRASGSQLAASCELCSTSRASLRVARVAHLLWHVEHRLGTCFSPF